MTRHKGFTLLELLISLAIFSLLGLAGGQLFDGLFRVREQVRQQEQDLRALLRAVAIIERDVLQVIVSPKRQAIQVRHGVLNLHRGNWRNPLGHSRGERQEVSYVIEQGQLWRHSRSPDGDYVHKQLLLRDVRSLEWRLYDRKLGWQDQWPTRLPADHPRALEMVLSVPRLELIRRVIPLAGDA